MATRSAAREPYEVDLLPSAARELDELPDAVREEAYYLINALAEDPRPPDAEPLRSYANRYKIKFYRVRTRPRFRLIYEVNDPRRRVLVTAVRLRNRETYRGMNRW